MVSYSGYLAVLALPGQAKARIKVVLEEIGVGIVQEETVYNEILYEGFAWPSGGSGPVMKNVLLKAGHTYRAYAEVSVEGSAGYLGSYVTDFDPALDDHVVEVDHVLINF